ncbi:MAG TPA: sigma-70 family RNA polymerase sigma factor [Thermomicrobiales bacterium]
MAAPDSTRQVNGLKTAAAGASAFPAGESDPELVARLRDADATALATLYDRYAPAVHGLTRAILRDDRLAEEATHDVFLGVWQDPAAYQPARGVFAAWLLRVARNRAIDLLRRRREQPFAATVIAETGQVLDPATWLVDPDPDPADQAATRLLGQDVRRALASLAPDHQRLLEMAYFGGMTQREIAAAVNRPLGTVKTQIRTAMQRMADLLTENDCGPDGRWPRRPEHPAAYELSGGGGAESR